VNLNSNFNINYFLQCIKKENRFHSEKRCRTLLRFTTSFRLFISERLSVCKQVTITEPAIKFM